MEGRDIIIEYEVIICIFSSLVRSCVVFYTHLKGKGRTCGGYSTSLGG